MRRGMMALLVLAAVVLLSVGAGASEMKGSVEVKLDAGELPVTNGAVSMYLVGVPTEGGYRLLDRYGGGIVRSEDAASSNLAYWLRELAGSGQELLLDVDGRVVFSGIEEGLYLLVQTQGWTDSIPSGPSWRRCPQMASGRGGLRRRCSPSQMSRPVPGM